MNDRQPAHGDKRKLNAEFVFVGAGGGALPLLQKVGHPGGQGVRRVPDRRPVPAHRQPGAGRRAPGQGVRIACRPVPPDRRAPHLDTRIINGKSWLLFGPFAGWSPKFLKQGNVTDLPLFGEARQSGASMLDVGSRRRAW